MYKLCNSQFSGAVFKLYPEEPPALDIACMGTWKTPCIELHTASIGVDQIPERYPPFLSSRVDVILTQFGFKYSFNSSGPIAVVGRANNEISINSYGLLTFRVAIKPFSGV